MAHTQLESVSSPERSGDPRTMAVEIADLLSSSAEAMTNLRERLRQLRDRLSVRFASEEASGRYENVLCQAPWLTARAQDLQQQHSELVGALDSFLELCEPGKEGELSAWWSPLQHEFEEFVDLLQEHEAAECEMLRETHPGPAWAEE
jgi:hypothetical protein